MQQLRNKIVTAWKRRKEEFHDYRKRNYQNTEKVVYTASLLLFGVLAALLADGYFEPAWLVFLAAVPVVFLGLAAMQWLVKKAVCILGRNGVGYFLSCILLLMSVLLVFCMDSSAGGAGWNFLFCILTTLDLILFLRSMWAVFYNKVRTPTTIAASAVTGIFLGAVCILAGSRGFEDTYIEAYQSLEAERPRKEQVQTEDFALGEYTVKSLTYGTEEGKDLYSGTADISPYAKNEGITGKVKQLYQGYSLDQVSLAGKIWYPKEAEQCPTLFLVHGNHVYTQDSYLGYEYLGTFLASHGYVVVSVDENACNELSSENDARAVLLLENMKQLRQFNGTLECELYGKMDYENLALAGHSRGGEAAAAAYLFNEYECCPDNGNLKWDYHFNIKSVIAIAPTADQYDPAGREVELRDVNYLLLHGANDQDVNYFMGMQQYERVEFSKEGDYRKASVYIAGCNHGQFNSRWGLYDLGEPLNRALNVENLMDEEEQQDAAKVFIKAFLDLTLAGDVSNEELFRDCRGYGGYLPDTLYIQSYEPSSLQCLCNFEEDTDITTGTMEGVRVSVQNADRFRGRVLYYSNGESRDNSVLQVEWEDKEEPVQVKLDFEDMDLADSGVQFDLMNLLEDFKEEEAALTEGEVRLTDADGNTVSAKLEGYAPVYPAFPVRLNKIQYLSGSVEYKHQFQTVSIPVSDFKGTEKFDESQVCRMEIRIEGEAGSVALDNIGVY